MGLDIDLELLREFERYLDPRRPEQSRIPARVLGYGEISTVFEIGDERQRDLAYKRMPIFEKTEELEHYESTFDKYCRVLTEEMGLELPEYGYASLSEAEGRPVMFLAQKKLPGESIGNKAIHLLDRDDTNRLIRQVLRELKKVWEFNASGGPLELGIDGQISNWSIKDFDPENPRLDEEVKLVYFDTSTPFLRVEGVEQLDPELFLRSAPSFLVWIMRLLFLEDVMTRYYDFHLVATDLIANFYKEQLPDYIPALVVEANDFFTSEAPGLDVEPLSEKEVRSYYREDAVIWSLYLNARRLDRFLRTRLARREYPYILPGKIKR
jgi:Family of unknown function (DUF6206)